jgi:hypothetical protein
VDRDFEDFLDSYEKYDMILCPLSLIILFAIFSESHERAYD